MARRNVVDFKIINLSEEKFQELKEAGQIDPNALYTTPDTTKERLDALEATAVNYDNITNCITEIPQDIKLELTDGDSVALYAWKLNNVIYYTKTAVANEYDVDIYNADRTLLYDGARNGIKNKNNEYIYAETPRVDIPTGHMLRDSSSDIYGKVLVLKAGSKVYVPNGAGVFDAVTIASDVQFTYGYGAATWLLFLSPYLSLDIRTPDECYSKASAPTVTEQYAFWYNTTNNTICKTADYGSTWTSGYSFPIAIITTNALQIVSIDQVFNGFGYIGSTIFALPGVKGLIPDGRNADGSLKNIPTNDFTTVKTVQANTYTAKIAMYSSGGLGSQTKNFGLNEPENYNYDSGVLTNALEVASVMVNSSGKITSFTPKTVFHAVDYNDLYTSTAGSLMPRILGAIYPAGSLYLTTYDTATCPIAELIPGSTWELIGSGRALWTGNGSNGGSTIAAGLPNVTGQVDNVLFDTRNIQGENGAFYWSAGKSGSNGGGDYARPTGAFAIAASRLSSVYGNSTTVQPPAYVVNVWRRTA